MHMMWYVCMHMEDVFMHKRHGLCAYIWSGVCMHIDDVTVKCCPRGVCGIQNTKLEGAKCPSAEWSKSS